MIRGRLAGMLVVLVLLAPSAASAAVHLDSVGTFAQPLYVTSFAGDPNRLLVAEQRGTVQLVQNGVASTYLDLDTPGLVRSGGEQGLLSLALAPDFATSHHLYVDYTSAQNGGALTVDEFTAHGDSVPLSSRRNLLSIPHPTFPNHNGGQLQFGPDGLLYISTGDGGSGFDPPGNAQNSQSLLGKILRIDPHPSPGGAPYTVPADNPFGGSPIWSYGLRNPWRFSFDRMTGDLLIGDVGQNAREEVDFVAPPDPGRGLNFGWDCREGFIAVDPPNDSPGCAGRTGFTEPIFDYDHDGGRCAIVGGYVVRDTTLASLYGRYLFSDSCDGTIRSLVPGLPAATDARTEDLDAGSPTSFGEDSCGRVYVASLDGDVSRFVGDSQPTCATTGPPPAAPPACAGRTATRTVGAGGKVEGTKGPDVIVADSGADRIRSGGGDDVICALGGRDRIHAGAGDDRIRGGRGRDKCVGGPGRDRTRSC